mgnify:CR=1 FL=1
MEIKTESIHGSEITFAQAGKGPVLLLVHGMGGTFRNWETVIGPLARRHTVIAPDLPGHGESGAGHGDYSLGSFASILRDLLLRLGHDRATLVGHSLGGGVVMQFGYQFPERVERLVLVDSGSREAREETLAKTAKIAKEDKKSNGKIVALVNTHWHPDQTGANEAIGAMGATIIAHAKTRQRLSAGWYVPKEDRYEKPLAMVGRPMRTFHATDAVTFGDRKLELGYLIEAHTDGDVYVRFAGANVIAAGDAISPQRDPVLDWFGDESVRSLVRLVESEAELAGASLHLMGSGRR